MDRLIPGVVRHALSFVQDAKELMVITVHNASAINLQSDHITVSIDSSNSLKELCLLIFHQIILTTQLSIPSSPI